MAKCQRIATGTPMRSLVILILLTLLATSPAGGEGASTTGHPKLSIQECRAALKFKNENWRKCKSLSKKSQVKLSCAGRVR